MYSINLHPQKKKKEKHVCFIETKYLTFVCKNVVSATTLQLKLQLATVVIYEIRYFTFQSLAV